MEVAKIKVGSWYACTKFPHRSSGWSLDKCQVKQVLHKDVDLYAVRDQCEAETGRRPFMFNRRNSAHCLVETEGGERRIISTRAVVRPWADEEIRKAEEAEVQRKYAEQKRQKDAEAAAERDRAVAAVESFMSMGLESASAYASYTGMRVLFTVEDAELLLSLLLAAVE